MDVKQTELKIYPRRDDGRRLSRKSVANDKLTGSVPDGSVVTSSIVSNAVTQTKIIAGAVGQSQLKFETSDITVLAGQTVGTGSCTSGSIIIGQYPKTNQDQFIKSISVGGTTITLTLLAAATADNIIKVILLKQ